MLCKKTYKKYITFFSSYGLGVIIALFFALFATTLFYELLHFQSQSKDLIDSRIFHTLFFTFYQALLSTLLSLFFGFILALSLAHSKHFLLKNVIISIISSTLVLPSIIVALGIIVVFGRNGWLNHIFEIIFSKNLGAYLYGLKGILLAHIFFNASYAAAIFQEALKSIPIQRYKLSKSLGMSFWQRLYYIELKELRSHIHSLFGTIFLLCFSSFAIILILGGSPAYNTLEVSIYEALRFDYDIALASKLSLIQVFISAIVLVIFSKKTLPSFALSPQTTEKNWLVNKKEKIAYNITIALSFLFFILPILAISFEGIKANLWDILHQKMFLKSFYISMKVAFISSIFTILSSLALSFAKANFSIRLHNNTFSKFITISSSLYLMIPSMVLALGFFIISKDFSISMDNIAMIALIFGNILLSLPFSTNTLYPKIEKIFLSYDKLIASINIKFQDRIKYIYIPYLKNELLYVFALSFSFSLGDLSIIALFGDNNISTLPWYLYQKMGSYQNSDANGIAFILFIMIFVLFYISTRLKSADSK